MIARFAASLGLALAVAHAAYGQVPISPPSNLTGQQYSAAREKLLASGWEPYRARDADRCESDDERCQGRPEMQSCSGSGRASCRFLWRKNGVLAVVITAGEVRPFVVSVQQDSRPPTGAAPTAAAQGSPPVTSAKSTTSPETIRVAKIDEVADRSVFLVEGWQVRDGVADFRLLTNFKSPQQFSGGQGLSMLQVFQLRCSDRAARIVAAMPRSGADLNGSNVSTSQTTPWENIPKESRIAGFGKWFCEWTEDIRQKVVFGSQLELRRIAAARLEIPSGAAASKNSLGQLQAQRQQTFALLAKVSRYSNCADGQRFFIHGLERAEERYEEYAAKGWLSKPPAVESLTNLYKLWENNIRQYPACNP